MALRSAIEWTESTWNPVTGCNKVSPGCKNCYAERMANRLRAMGQPNYKNGFRPTLHEEQLDLPLRWKRGQTIFVNSMSDLFHDAVPTTFVLRVFEVMGKATWHRFQILTKRSGRLLQLSSQLLWFPNVWMGVSVETDDQAWRIDDLRSTGAAVKFLSLEPLLGPLPYLNLAGIDWVIVGGESGPRARHIDPKWVTDIRDQCVGNGVPFSQAMGWQPSKANRTRIGRPHVGRTSTPSGPLKGLLAWSCSIGARR